MRDRINQSVLPARGLPDTMELGRVVVLGLPQQHGNTTVVSSALTKLGIDISKILIRGSTSDWLPVEDIPDAGKLQHIASVVAELTVMYGVSVEPEEVFLLDDDNTNVDSARQFGHKAFLVTKAFSYDKLNDYIKQIE